MFDSLKVWLLRARLPFCSGAGFHRAALQAVHRGDWPTAERLCELAGARYRRELACEPLARLRVHQRIAAARAGRDSSESADLEIERALARLERIEALSPPFALVDAHALMGQWTGGTRGTRAAPGTVDVPAQLAA